MTELETPKPEKTENESFWKYSAFILATILIVGSFVFFVNSKEGNDPTGQVINVLEPNIPETNEPIVLEIGESPVKGDLDAPVTIIEFSDFECPYCGRNFVQVYPLIVKNYVNTGKVKYSFKNFPLEGHSNAQKSSEAALCVREQLGDEGFWKMHDKLYQNQQSLSVENYKKWAKELGVDETKFNSCLDLGKFEGFVENDFKLGQSIGVSGTPAFFINGKPIVGAYPYTTFQKAIDAELAGKSWSINERGQVAVE